jgi:hypothetical protein
MKSTHAVALLAALALSSPAMAELVFLPGGRVTMIEASYMPGWVSFKLDVGDATCPAGTFLVWKHPNVDNNKTVYATLLAGLLSGRPVYAVYDTATVRAEANVCTLSNIGLQQ